MQKFNTIVLGLILAASVSCQSSNNEMNSSSDSTNVNEVTELKTKLERHSYAIGIDMGTNLKKQYIEVDLSALVQGIRDGMSDGKWLLTEDDYVTTVQEFQNEQRINYQHKRAVEAERNKEKGEKFLEENKKKAGIMTLPSGIQYRVINAGSGSSPSETDVVTAHYTGRLIDGTEFDSSVKRGQPFKTAVNQVIPGWTEILQKMKVGDKWEVFISAELAYGERGSGIKIGPNEVLIFEMELLSIEGK